MSVAFVGVPFYNIYLGFLIQYALLKLTDTTVAMAAINPCKKKKKRKEKESVICLYDFDV